MPSAQDISKMREKLRALFVLHGWNNGPVTRDGVSRFVTEGGSLTGTFNRKGIVTFKPMGCAAQMFDWNGQPEIIEEYIINHRDTAGESRLHEYILIASGRRRVVINSTGDETVNLSVETRSSILSGSRGSHSRINLNRDMLVTLRDQLSTYLDVHPVLVPIPVSNPVGTVVPDHDPLTVGTRVRVCPAADSDLAGSRNRRFGMEGEIAAVRTGSIRQRQPGGPTEVVREYAVRFPGDGRGTFTYSAGELTIVEGVSLSEHRVTPRLSARERAGAAALLRDLFGEVSSATAEEAPPVLRRVQVGMSVRTCAREAGHPDMPRRRHFDYEGQVIAVVGESQIVRGEPEYEVEFGGGTVHHYLEAELTVVPSFSPGMYVTVRRDSDSVTRLGQIRGRRFDATGLVEEVVRNVGGVAGATEYGVRFADGVLCCYDAAEMTEVSNSELAT